MGIEIPRVNGNFEGGEGGGTLSCAEMAEVEPIKLPFGMWTCVGPRNHVLDGVHIGTTWRIRLNRPCADAALCQIPLTTC